MVLAIFLLSTGALAGWLTWHSGIGTGLMTMLLGAGGTAALDAGALLWRTRPSAEPFFRRDWTQPWAELHRPRGAGPSAHILWRMVQDTCEVSAFITLLVGGLTYALLLVVELAKALIGR